MGDADSSSRAGGGAEGVSAAATTGGCVHGCCSTGLCVAVEVPQKTKEER